MRYYSKFCQAGISAIAQSIVIALTVKGSVGSSIQQPAKHRPHCSAIFLSIPIYKNLKTSIHSQNNLCISQKHALV